MRRLLTALAAAVLAVLTAPVAVAQDGDGAVGQCTPPANTPNQSESWAQTRMSADRVWPLTTGSVTVGVIDTGVSAAAPTLSGAVLPGSGAGGGRGDDDCYGRGTFIAGLIAARPGAGRFVGVAPGATIYPVRVTDDPPKISDHSALSKDIAAGIRSAVDGGASVIAVGQASTIGTNELESAVRYAADRNVVVFATAAVSKKGQLAFPARYPEVVAVAPIDEQGPLSELVYGADPDLAAPADNLVSIGAEGKGNRTGSGAELAVGYAAGTAALVRDYHQGLPAAQVVERMKDTADQPSGELPDKYLGYGVVDPFAAVTTVVDADQPAQPSVDEFSVPLPAGEDPEPGNRALWFAGAVAAAALLIAGPAIVAAKEKKRRES